MTQINNDSGRINPPMISSSGIYISTDAVKSTLKTIAFPLAGGISGGVIGGFIGFKFVNLVFPLDHTSPGALGAALVLGTAVVGACALSGAAAGAVGGLSLRAVHLIAGNQEPKN